MAENTIVARPYAKAIFELAREGGAFEEWGNMLALACTTLEDDAFLNFMHSPDAEPEHLVDIILSVCGEHAGELQQNFLRLLAENRRIGSLQAIAEEYESLRDEYENVADVEVISAVPLSEEQKQEIGAAMKSRLGKNVRLNCDVDAALIGGAIIRSGDMVIDGSLRGRLEELAGAVTH
jgi:F-type H+-transporting ATPase subunit delta